MAQQSTPEYINIVFLLSYTFCQIRKMLLIHILFRNIIKVL